MSVQTGSIDLQMPDTYMEWWLVKEELNRLSEKACYGTYVFNSTHNPRICSSTQYTYIHICSPTL